MGSKITSFFCGGQFFVQVISFVVVVVVVVVTVAADFELESVGLG
jgi:hypothetical protein